MSQRVTFRIQSRFDDRCKRRHVVFRVVTFSFSFPLSLSLCLFLFLYNGSNGFFEKLGEEEFARTSVPLQCAVMRSLIKRKFIGSRGYCKGD